MTKSTITREESIQAIFDLKVGYSLGLADIEILKRVARMALNAMDSESGCLPLDYLQGHKDGLEWAAQLAEANHPETGDWLYDDPIELAKAIRKGPDMPPAQPAPVVPEEAYSDDCPELYPSQPDAWAAGWNACRAAMLQAEPVTTANKLGNSPEQRESRCGTKGSPALDSSSKNAESRCGNSPVIPDCWCRTCRPLTLNDMRFVVCPDCGNKRCPLANDHRNNCSGSNDPDQEGSAYPAAPQEVKGD